MQLSLHCVGKLKSAAEKDLAADYLERTNQLSRRAGFHGLAIHEILESRSSLSAERMADEAARLAGGIHAGAMLVVFDGRGQSLSTEAFTTLIKQQADSGTPVMAFAIGGPDGHGDAIRQRAQKSVALGAMTWPHRLVRVMVLEQIYRAVTIMVKHPYHRP
jgi:23S rRNA (pseudouridine1915-N3)-methyltransferase